MSGDEIQQLLDNLTVIPNVIDGKIRIDFFYNDELLGDMYYVPNIIKGQRKPIQQTVYIIDASDMRKVIDYINSNSPIQEEDLQLIHKTINMYCQNVIEKWGRERYLINN